MNSAYILRIGSIVRIKFPYKHVLTNGIVRIDEELYELIKVDSSIVEPIRFSKDIIENILKLNLASKNVYQLFGSYKLLLNYDNSVELQEYGEFILRLKENIKYLHELQQEFFDETGRELEINLDIVIKQLYNQDSIKIDQVMHFSTNLFRLTYSGYENYSTGLDNVIDESKLRDEQKERVKNDLGLNPVFIH